MHKVQCKDCLPVKANAASYVLVVNQELMCRCAGILSQESKEKLRQLVKHMPPFNFDLELQALWATQLLCLNCYESRCHMPPSRVADINCLAQHICDLTPSLACASWTEAVVRFW